MSPTYTRKANRHYHYYVSQAALQYRDQETGSVVRVPAGEVEGVVVGLIHDLMNTPARLIALAKPFHLDPEQTDKMIRSGRSKVAGWDQEGTTEQIKALSHYLESAEVGRSRITIRVHERELVEYLLEQKIEASEQGDDNSASHTTLSASVSLKRTGIESKYVYPESNESKVHNRSVKALQSAVLTALRWNEQLMSGEVASMTELVEHQGLNPRQFHRLRKLAFLAPDIIERIIAGNVPASLTLEKLKADFPASWPAQREYFSMTD